MPEQKEREFQRDLEIKAEKRLDKSEEIDISEHGEREFEVESVVEKMEKVRKKRKKQGKKKKSDDVAVVAEGDGQPSVTLPVNKGVMERGEKMSLRESLRWLVEQIKRKIKMVHGRVVFKEENDE